jgi:hypothetical protein
LIYLANLVIDVPEIPQPSEFDQETWSAQPEGNLQGLSQEEVNTRVRAIYDAAAVRAERWLQTKFPRSSFPELWEYFGPINAMWVGKICPKYLRLFEGRRILAEAVRASSEPPPAGRSSAPIKATQTFAGHLSQISVTVSLAIENGRFIKTANLLDSLVGIEAARVRRCEVDGRFFWATRKDRRGCSAGCANTLRQRRWREKYLTDYKVQRVRKADADEARKR